MRTADYDYEPYRPEKRSPPRRSRSKAPANDIVTEDSAALQFAAKYGGKLRFCHDTGAWFEWNGHIWQQNRVQLAFHFARELARALTDGQSAKARAVIEKTSFAAGVERFCRADPTFAITINHWDADDMLLGTPGGTIDLRTGELRKADPADGITRSCAITPSVRAECPLWLKFLDEATGSDGHLIRFMQQWCGYALTGLTIEHALLFIFGGGGNGKSVFINVINGILNTYASTAAMDAFTASKHEKHPTDMAMLRGARLVTASETEEGHAWAESRLKLMTGGDQVTARFMRQDFFTYVPKFKLTVVGNHKPVLKNIDEAARRRFNIVPFTRKPAKPDRQLEAKLKEEWPGILRWMIEGCLDWQANGLVRPDSVKAATEAYFSDQDLFGQWLDDECDVEPDNPYKWEAGAKLFDSWSAYARAAGEDAGSKKSFAELMQRRGFEAVRKNRNKLRAFSGVQLRPTMMDGR